MEGWHLPLPQGMPYNSTSSGYETSRKAASGPCKLFGLQGYNSGAAQFILVINDEELPSNGAVPEIIIAAAATSIFSAYFGTAGRWFSRGIILANSSTGPTLTIGAADCWFDVQYI
jgi:hypothetical protein